MIESHLRTNVALVIGVFASMLALMETLSGTALQGYGQMVDRRKDPRTFWKAVALHYLCGVSTVGFYLYLRILAN